MKDLGNKRLAIILIVFIAVVTAVTVGGVISFGNKMFRVFDNDSRDGITGNHYAFVCENIQDGFYGSVFEGARREAEDRGDYLENIGSNLAYSRDKYELMELSIDAKVDGIIVDAGESDAMRELIDRADAEGIPVVTVGGDNTSSARKSYVGFGYYDLGVNYGKELLKSASDEQKRVLVLMRPDAEDSSQNIIFQGLKETIERAGASASFKLETMAIPNTSTFGAEERISALIMRDGELPEIMICLNEIFTTCVCQALVDYNKVGQTVVYGFYENSTILSSIQKNIIYATVTMNTDQMGVYCIEALKEFEETGYVNEYLPADIIVVTADNLDEYLSEKERGQEGEADY